MLTPFLRKVLCAVLALIFGLSGTLSVQAQELILPKPGVMVHLSSDFSPALLKGLKIQPDKPFQFDFILDRGESQMSDEALKDESNKLIKYFLASLTVPEGDLWVNLSPYEKDRIVPESFGQTDMGRDLLAQDYLLKQITASLIYPEDEFGQKFWKRVYEEAAQKFGTTNIPVNTFNKVWIVPSKAVVYENAKAGTAYVVESRLKVMLEQDYLSMEKHVQAGDAKAEALSARNGSEDGRGAAAAGPAALASQVIREIVIPQLEKEVNEGKNFAQLRQVYSSLILAAWYKKKIKDSILSQVYADKNKIKGIEVIPAKAGIQDKELIYQQYLQAFKKGVYNYIKEEQDPATGTMIPRKYFSGGVIMGLGATSVAAGGLLQVRQDVPSSAMISEDRAMLIKVQIDQPQGSGGGTRNIKGSGFLKGYSINVHPSGNEGNEVLFNADVYSDADGSKVNGIISYSINDIEKTFQLTGFYPNFPQRSDGYPRAAYYLPGQGAALLKELLRPYAGYEFTVHAATGYLPPVIKQMDFLAPVLESEDVVLFESLRKKDPKKYEQVNVYGRVPEDVAYRQVYADTAMISDIPHAGRSAYLLDAYEKGEILSSGIRDWLSKRGIDPQRFDAGIEKAGLDVLRRKLDDPDNNLRPFRGGSDATVYRGTVEGNDLIVKHIRDEEVWRNKYVAYEALLGDDGKTPLVAGYITAKNLEIYVDGQKKVIPFAVIQQEVVTLVDRIQEIKNERYPDDVASQYKEINTLLNDYFDLYKRLLAQGLIAKPNGFLIDVGITKGSNQIVILDVGDILTREEAEADYGLEHFDQMFYQLLLSVALVKDLNHPHAAEGEGGVFIDTERILKPALRDDIKDEDLFRRQQEEQYATMEYDIKGLARELSAENLKSIWGMSKGKSNRREMYFGNFRIRQEMEDARLAFIGESIQDRAMHTPSDQIAKTKAAILNPGGIDLNADKLALEVRNNGQEMAFKADPALLEEWRNVPGFTPEIISITPAGNIQAFLGIPAH